jgi:enoyl-[acyl-carrier protein] reductase I
VSAKLVRPEDSLDATENDVPQLLDGKKGLVLGVANDHSIGWGIAQALHAQGAEVGLTYRREGRARHVEPLAARLGAKLVARCDFRDDGQIADLMDQAHTVYGRLDFLVHAAAGASTRDLNGPYLNTTRATFLDALDASAYSLTAIVAAALDLLNPGASIVTLTYHGSRQVAANYNVMGVAKAALEASVRYLANDLGPGQIRINAISAGPIRTLSASGIAGFRTRHKRFAQTAPLGRNVTIEDVGKMAVWLCSDWAGAVTGEVVYVDAGLHQVAASAPA